MEPAGRSPLRSDNDDNDNEAGDDEEVPAQAAVAAGAAAEEDEHNGHVHPEVAAAAAAHLQEEPNGERATSSSTGRGTGQLKVAQEEEGEEDEEEDIDPLFSLQPHMLTLTDQERQWAKQVRNAVDGLDDVDFTVTDFMCAHLGIASHSQVQADASIEWVVERVYRMQEVRKGYKILGTYQEGRTAIRALFDLLPGVILDFQCNPTTGECFVIIDQTQPVKELWKNHKNIETTIRGCFYFCHAQFPSLECVRVGNVHMFESEGYEWGKGMGDVKEFSRLTHETVGAFPVVLQATRFYNTPALLNCLVSMAKKVIPADIAGGISFGHKFAGGTTLRQLYLVPTRQAASARVCEIICRSLKLRFQAEEAFSL